MKAVLLAILCVAFLGNSYGQSTMKAPKNIILLIGDGMGENAVLATDYYTAGIGAAQAYENFPVSVFMSTSSASLSKTKTANNYSISYDADSAWSTFNFVKLRFTDSAPAATSMSTGVKTFNGSIGMDMNQQPLFHITQRAEELGKSCGVISSVQFSHATPAGFVAHNIDRNNYADIAREMLLDSKLEVIMGCGNPDFDDNGVAATKDAKYVGGSTFWNELKAGNLTFTDAAPSTNKTVLDIDNDGQPDGWKLIQSVQDFRTLMNAQITPKRVLGVPNVYSTLQQSRTVVNSQFAFSDPFTANLPNLKEMTKGAINVLDNNPNGFFLMIEGGAIDWAAHANQAGRVIEETDDFNKAVQAVVSWVEANSSWDETLVIVTADHETGYITGPNTDDNNPNTNPVVNNGKEQMPGMKFNSAEHTNTLVPLYAMGAGSEMFKTMADEEDLVRGRFIDNTDIANGCFYFWPAQPYKTAKNVILMISDGCGENQLLATNYYTGKTQTYENFPFKAYMSTYPAALNMNPTLANMVNGYNSKSYWTEYNYAKRDVTDSAPAASTMASGVKTYNGSINTDIYGQPMYTILQMAESMDKSTGVITTVEWTHATPAGFIAHNSNRNNYDQIGREMILDSELEVIMGAGNPDFDDNGVATSTKEYKYVGGSDAWTNLQANSTTYGVASLSGNMDVQDIDNDGNKDAWTLIQDKSAFENLMTGVTPKRVLGTAKVRTTTQQSRTSGDPQLVNQNLNTTVPSLAVMTKGALNVLDNNNNGFVLMI